MTTEQELRTVQGEELSRLLGEVLQPERKYHVGLWGTFNKKGFRCKFCNKDILYDATVDSPPCNSPDPIPLNDWNVAMKWRDWAVKEYGEVKFKQAMIDMYALEDEYMNMMFGVWLTLYAKPEHYLIAATLCKLKGK